MISTTIRHNRFTRRLRRRGLGAALVLVIGVLLHHPWAWALQVSGLESPHSFLADPATMSYFISNINGETDARDKNGFITKLSDDGRITAFKFIEGGRGDVTLHAPKGMVVADDVLYVTDLDALRAFDKTTGKPLATLALPRPAAGGAAQSLTDVASDGQGHLYLADQGGNAIYRVDLAPTLTLSLYVSGAHLAWVSLLTKKHGTGTIRILAKETPQS